jgi:hypothetical protein
MMHTGSEASLECQLLKIIRQPFAGSAYVSHAPISIEATITLPEGEKEDSDELWREFFDPWEHILLMAFAQASQIFR